MKKICVLYFLITAFNFCLGQNECTPIKKLQIPTDRHVYMLGDFHLDAKKYIQADEQTITNTIAAEDELRNYLVNKCDVKHFFLESSVSFEYFFNKYIQTGDTSWISIFNQQEYELSKLESLRDIYLKHNDITINCIDVVLNSYVQQMLMTLYALSFYEHFQKYYETPYQTEKLYPPWNDINVGMKLLDSLPQCNDSITPFLGVIIQSLIAPDEYTNYNLYILFKISITSSQAQEALKKFYGNDYKYVMRIINGYIFGYGKTSEDILYNYVPQRENIIENTVAELMKIDTKSAYLIQMGNFHLSPDPNANMLRYRLLQKPSPPPFCFYNVQKMAKTFFEQTFKTVALDFSFDSNYCFKKGDTDNVYVLVK